MLPLYNINGVPANLPAISYFKANEAKLVLPFEAIVNESESVASFQGAFEPTVLLEIDVDEVEIEVQQSSEEVLSENVYYCHMLLIRLTSSCYRNKAISLQLLRKGLQIKRWPDKASTSSHNSK